MDDNESSEWIYDRDHPKNKKNYQCPFCLKKFKTQPILNVHTKQNHDKDELPLDRNAQKLISRGRPKQIKYKDVDESKKESQNPLDQIYKIQTKNESEISAREIYEKEAVWKIIQKFIDQEPQEQQPKLNSQNMRDVTLGRGLAILIEDLSQKVKEEQLREEVTLLLTIYSSYIIEESEDMNVLSNGKVGLMPQFANIFILYELNKRCERLKLSQTWISRPKTAVQVLSIIFRWLNYKSFTYTVATINQTDDLRSNDQEER